MQKFLTSASQTVLAAVLLLSAPLVHAQTGGKMSDDKMKSGKMGSMDKMSQDGCMMKDGKMMMMKDGKMMPMTENMTTADGTVCMPDGTCKMKDGTTMKMKDGQHMMMDGKMTMMGDMKKGGKMKSGKMGNMKM
jgi:hypothetical protein